MLKNFIALFTILILFLSVSCATVQTQFYTRMADTWEAKLRAQNLPSAVLQAGFWETKNISRKLGILRILGDRSDMAADSKDFFKALDDHPLIAEAAIALLHRNGHLPLRAKVTSNLDVEKLKVLVDLKILQMDDGARLKLKIHLEEGNLSTHTWHQRHVECVAYQLLKSGGRRCIRYDVTWEYRDRTYYDGAIRILLADTYAVSLPYHLSEEISYHCYGGSFGCWSRGRFFDINHFKKIVQGIDFYNNLSKDFTAVILPVIKEYAQPKTR